MDIGKSNNFRKLDNIDRPFFRLKLHTYKNTRYFKSLLILLYILKFNSLGLIIYQKINGKINYNKYENKIIIKQNLKNISRFFQKLANLSYVYMKNVNLLKHMFLCWRREPTTSYMRQRNRHNSGLQWENRVQKFAGRSICIQFVLITFEM